MYIFKRNHTNKILAKGSQSFSLLECNKILTREKPYDSCDQLCQKCILLWLYSVAQLCPAICSPVDCRPPGFFGFPRQEFWSGLLYPPLGDLPNLGIESRSPALRADLYHPRHQGSPLKTIECIKRFRGCVCV